jgi:hypothetical protein
MVNTVDLNRKFYDPMAGFRDLAANGNLSSDSRIIKDPRSTNTKCL